MQRLCRTRLWGPVIFITGIVAAATARSDAVSDVNVLRAGGCGGILPAAPSLQHDVLLDRVAADWAAGHTLAAAAERGGYRATPHAGVHVRGQDPSLLEVMRRSACGTVMDRSLREIGTYHAGLESWLVMIPAEPTPAGTPAQPAAQRPSSSAAAAASPETRVAARTKLQALATPALATRALQLVNEVRARGTRCGSRAFAPAPPVALSGTLAEVAFGHATDMAEHGYFEHDDLTGQSPADRVRAVGYRERLVGENIAYGPQSVDEVVRGWLDSPDHCENIMDPRFAEMGIAYAAGRTSRHGRYWVQVLAEPRA